jgi:CBS domain-containing protein
MKAHEIMTRAVHTAKRDTSIGDIARLMTKERISGVPIVTDDGDVIGIVSETDLMHRAETGTQRRRKWWLAMFLDSDSLARDYVKVHGLEADDVMTRYVISVSEDATLADVADILETNKLKRVPVLSNGKLVGIITRGDLVRALAAADTARGAARKDDAALQKALTDSIGAKSWLKPAYITATVNGGVVELWGFIGSEDQRKALHVLVQEVTGVREIRDNLRLGLRQFSAVA